MLGTTLGEEMFTDLDFADDVALLAQILEILLQSLDVMQHETRLFGLEINWTKTKIQHIDNYVSPPSVPHNQSDGQRSISSSIICLSRKSVEQLWRWRV